MRFSPYEQLEIEYGDGGSKLRPASGAIGAVRTRFKVRPSSLRLEEAKQNPRVRALASQRQGMRRMDIARS